MMHYLLVRIARLAAVAALAALLVACGGGPDAQDERTAGDERSFLMGFSSLPRELNAESYERAIEVAGDNADVVLIQRQLPWDDFLPGAGISGDTAEGTASERGAVEDHGLRLFYAIDPTDGATGRERLGGLPESLGGQRFDHPDIRAAFLSYAEYIAINYKPEYLALGVEMNLYYEKNRDDWENFLSLYAEAYAAVKKASPETMITVTMQYEDLQGLLPREDRHFPDWQLVQDFTPDLDFVGISTYPSLIFGDVSQMPENYYSQLTAFTDQPIAIAEMGYSSAAPPGTGGAEDQQSAFVERAMRDAEDLDMLLAVWFAIWDPSYALNTEYGAFTDIGLLRSDDTAKPAWELWSSTARRPYGGD